MFGLRAGVQDWDAIPYCVKAISLCKSRIQNLEKTKRSLLADEGDNASSAEGGSEEDEIQLLTDVLIELEKKLKDLEQEMSTPSPATDEIMKRIASKASGEQNVGNAMPRAASLTCSQIAGSSTGFDSTTMSTAATTGITRSLEELAVESHPVRILEFSERVLRRKVIKFVKVLWSNQTEREATWELENMMRQKYPELFQTENGTAEAQESKLCLPQA